MEARKRAIDAYLEPGDSSGLSRFSLLHAALADASQATDHGSLRLGACG